MVLPLEIAMLVHLLFMHNVLAHRTRYLRSVLLQIKMTIFTKACKNRMS